MILNTSEIQNEEKAIRFVQRNIDIITAVLLLTGQITIIGVFVTPGGFRLTVGGPLTGASRLESKSGSKTVNAIVDVIDIILAILLIADQINVRGTFLTSKRFTLNIGGPITGVPSTVPDTPDLKEILTDFKVISKHFYIDQELVNQLMKE
ncbi:hypothetical protein [Fictibacillus gelatini]|uniref:hypothetical protein n=1 Tax=Fictibacillus gelatini TaxID=225985 RepID=UPI00042518ED|nr:hypothetical protein [Fictibacillus gelatini]